MSQNSEPASWYYATLIMKTTVGGDARTVIHANTVLVLANGADDAYTEAMALGSQDTRSDINPQGKRVESSFLGVSELDEIGPTLEHGTELFFSETIGRPGEESVLPIPPKSELLAFRERGVPTDKPDYSSIEIVYELKKHMRGEGDGSPN